MCLLWMLEQSLIAASGRGLQFWRACDVCDILCCQRTRPAADPISRYTDRYVDLLFLELFSSFVNLWKRFGFGDPWKFHARWIFSTSCQFEGSLPGCMFRVKGHGLLLSLAFEACSALEWIVRLEICNVFEKSFWLEVRNFLWGLLVAWAQLRSHLSSENAHCITDENLTKSDGRWGFYKWREYPQGRMWRWGRGALRDRRCVWQQTALWDGDPTGTRWLQLSF